MEAYVKASDLERLKIRRGRRLMGKKKAAIRASTFFLVRRSRSRAPLSPCPSQGIDAISSTFVMPEIACNDPLLNENTYCKENIYNGRRLINNIISFSFCLFVCFCSYLRV